MAKKLNDPSKGNKILGTKQRGLVSAEFHVPHRKA